MCRYLRYADAGDQFVGRTIALVGFLNSWMFAVLPPHFIEDVTPTILELFPICGLLPSMIPVCRLALASVVYHATRPHGGFDFPPTHELMKTALFSDRSKLAALSTKLNTDMYRSEHMTATGIPPYVCLFMEIAGIPAKVKEMFQEVLRDVHILPRPDESALMQTVLSKLTSIEARISEQAPAHGSVDGRGSGHVDGVQSVYNTKLKRFSCLPEDYALPKKLIDIFSHWWCSSMWGSRKIPPLRSECVSVLDFDVRQHRVWSDCKHVMLQMQQGMDGDMLAALQDSTTISVSLCTRIYSNGMTARLWPCLSSRDHARMKVSYASKVFQKQPGAMRKRKIAQK